MARPRPLLPAGGSPAPPASTTTSAVPAPPPPRAAAATVGPRPGLIDGPGAAIHLLAIEGRDGGLGLLVRLHLDEREALGLPRRTVRDDLGRLHRAERRKEGLQVGVGDPVGQVADIQLFPQRQTP